MRCLSARRRSRPIVLGLLLVVLLVGVAASSNAAGTGTVKVVVKYPVSAGVYRPLPNVEVFLWAAGASHYACTNASGVVTFTNIAAGGGYFTAIGVSISSLHCSNAEFLKPGTGLKLYNVSQGDITLAAGQMKTVQLRTGQPPADQSLVCGGEIPTIVGTAAGDKLVGTPGNDIISGGGGNDLIKGLGGNDWLCGGPGRDRILGGAGNDVLFGEAGNESGGNRGLFGQLGTDVAYGGAGVDTCDAEFESSC
jgi:hypothetical protein